MDARRDSVIDPEAQAQSTLTTTNTAGSNRRAAWFRHIAAVLPYAASAAIGKSCTRLCLTYEAAHKIRFPVFPTNAALSAFE